MINTDRLAGDLYNALAQRHVLVQQTNYYAGGGWRLRIASRGGMLRGVPTVEYIPPLQAIRVNLLRLFGSKKIGSFNLETATNNDYLIEEICALVVPLAK